MSLRVLELLSEFDAKDDREGKFASFRTHVPWVAPEAYLNIVFGPAPREILTSAVRRLKIPRVFVDFLAWQNGAILFSGALHIYGVHGANQYLDRSDVFARLPFNIDDENASCGFCDPDRLLAVGGYGFDGSLVCIDRRDLGVGLFKKNDTLLRPAPTVVWEGLDHWLRSEINRLSILFDRQGHLLASDVETLPLSRKRN